LGVVLEYYATIDLIIILVAAMKKHLQHGFEVITFVVFHGRVEAACRNHECGEIHIPTFALSGASKRETNSFQESKWDCSLQKSTSSR
jgi:hypothetical protein